MLVADIMVPCISGNQCRLDWDAISAIGGWLAAIATFLAVYVPAKNYRIDSERRAQRERQVSYIEINRLIPRVLDVRSQAKTIRDQIIPSIPMALAQPGVTSVSIASLLRVKGSVPFAILSDGLERISIGTSNLQSGLDVVAAYLEDGVDIPMYPNHPFHRLTDYGQAMTNIEKAADNLLLAIGRIAGVKIETGENQSKP